MTAEQRSIPQQNEYPTAAPEKKAMIGDCLPDIDDAVRCGSAGEELLYQALNAEESVQAFRRNPLVPHPKYAGRYCESDALVLAENKLFCLEMKNLTGAITYETTPKGVNKHVLVQHKARRGGVIEKKFDNPFNHTKRFIAILQRYMRAVDPQWAQLAITPGLIFGPAADIHAIRDPDGGILGIADLPAFLRRHGQPIRDPLQPTTLRAMLSAVPRWDRVRTVRGDWIDGILQGESLRYVKRWGGDVYHCPWREVRYVTIEPGEFFETLTVYKHGPIREYTVRIVDGCISLGKGNDVQVYELRDLLRIEVHSPAFKLPGATP